jgi:predicted XRE-type DNA-binding protein
VLDGQRLSVKKAKEITGIAAADFSRIRRANLERFTVDRLMTILALRRMPHRPAPWQR